MICPSRSPDTISDKTRVPAVGQLTNWNREHRRAMQRRANCPNMSRVNHKHRNVRHRRLIELHRYGRWQRSISALDALGALTKAK